MPISHQLGYPEPNIISWKISGHWTWDEIMEYDELSLQWMQKRADTCIYVIVDLLETNHLPQNGLSVFTNMLVKGDPENHGLTIFIVKNPFIKSMFHISESVNKEVRERYRAVGTLEEAREIIAKAQAE